MRIQFLPDGSLFVLIIITNKVVINKIKKMQYSEKKNHINHIIYNN